jgi:NAD(P)-dependent dehydrogenase (short-subunit alcohol dehydrogenase family)
MGFFDGLLDASIVLSFDRTGFRRHARRFKPEDLKVSLAGKVVLVTGANSGLGFEAAKALAALGATVVLACRDAGRGAEALERIRAELPAASLKLAVLDVSSLAAVRAFAHGWEGRLDVLVNNAGVLPPALQLTAEGHELTFATNVLGPMLLTLELLPALRATAGRVVTVSSGGMYTVRLSRKLLRGEVDATAFDGVVAYAQTKRAEVILSELFAAREPTVTFSCMHPGWADTPSVKSSLPNFHKLTRAILRTPAEGADTVVWLAACARLSGTSGLFWFDREPAPTHKLASTREQAGEPEALWDEVMAAIAQPDGPTAHARA